MLKQKFVISYGTQLIIQFVAIISSIFMARIAGPEVLGTLTFSLAYAGTFGFLLNMGLGSAHLRLVAAGRPLDRCMGTYIRLIIVPMLTYVVISLGSVRWQYVHYPEYFKTTASLIAVVLAIFNSFIVATFSIITLTYNAQLKQAKASVPMLIISIIDNMGRILLVIIGFRVLGLSVWWIVVSLALLITYVAGAKGIKIGHFDKTLAGEYLKIAFPLLLAGLVSSQMSNIDKVILKYFSSEVEVGYYGASFRLGGFIQMIAASIGTIFFPLFSKAISEQNFDYVKEKIDQFERFSDSFILPLGMAAVIFSDLIVKVILGKQYYPSIVPMSIVTLALYISVQNTPYMNVISGAGKFYKATWLSLIQLIILVCSLILFVHPELLALKATGAALALLVANLAGTVIFRVAARHELKGLNIWKYLPLWAVVLLTSAVFYWINSNLSHRGILYQFLLAPCFLTLVYALIWKMRYINLQELHMLKDLLNPRNTVDYITNEYKDR